MTPLLPLTLLICVTTLAQQQDEPNSNKILETFPPGFTRRAAKLRATMNKQQPDGEVIRLAEAYARQGRASGDPRSIRLATSLLEPLSMRTNSSADVLVIIAGLKSYDHDFSTSLQLLDRAILVNGSSAEARLQKISTLITLGRFDDARRLFRAHPALLGESRGIVLLGQLSSLTGQLRSSYSLLERHLEKSTNVSFEEKAWGLGILAEMAERMGDPAGAEGHYRKALESVDAAGDVDIYLSNAWMDFLIDQRRNAEAIAFATTSPLRDNLLLRKVIAAPKEEETRTLEVQFFQNASHEREQSLFLLKVKHDASGALRYALKNWQVQKEAIDVRLVLESAAAAQDMSAAEHVIAWMNANQYEDARLAPCLQKEQL